jgi:hypoxanthine phosphoribosyltransferase
VKRAQFLICRQQNLSNGGHVTKTRVTEFEVLTWNRTYNVLLSLARKIVRSGYVPDVIVGVSRGGWIPARVLCDLLSVPVLANIGVEFYTGVGDTKRRPRLTQPLSTDVSCKKVLLVDEVVDTGQSLKLAQEHIVNEGAKEVKTATMYTKLCSSIEPCYHEKETTSWIVFPWETRETILSIVIGSKWEKRRELDDLNHAKLSAKQAQKFLNEILRKECQNL